MGKYDHIINHPHHQSKTRPHMSLLDRAAQFAPFAALTGYDESVNEAARTTDERIELSETQVDELNLIQSYLTEHLSDALQVTITFFVPDKKKAGGKYITKEGIIKKIDEYKKVYVMEDGTVIPIADVLKIEGDGLPSVW